MKKQKGFTSYGLLMTGFFLIGLLMLGGWVNNIIKIVGAGFDVMNGMLIARCIGVFVAPLGGVLGFF